jgi:hypothetical protein
MLICCILFFTLLGAGSSSPVYAKSESFGLVSVGESSETTFGGMFVSNFTSPSDVGNITQISVYLATGGTSAKAVIYSDTNGAPDALLAQSANVSIDGTSGAWITFGISYSGTPNTPYWLGVLLSSAGTYYFAAGVSGKAIYSASVSDAPSTLTNGAANPNQNLSIYAVYTPPASGDQGGNWIPTVLLGIAVAGLIVAAIGAITLIRRKKLAAEASHS